MENRQTNDSKPRSVCRRGIRELSARAAVLAVLIFLSALLSAGCGRTGELTSPAQTAAAEETELPVRETDAADPRDGCVFVEIEGSFEEPDPEQILGRLNEIRREACEEGVMNPSTGEPLTPEDYVPLAWSRDLERTAMLRAAEASVLEDHVRPNGKDCFSVAYDGMKANYETLAWGYEDILASVDGWYSEKEAYTRETGEVASHYIALITPGNRFAGAAAFTPAEEGARTVCAAEFAMAQDTAAGSEEGQAGGYGPCRQTIEVVQEGGN